MTAGDVWFHRYVPNWHPDGAFSGTSPPPPALVAMYCEEPPRRGGSVLRCWGDEDPAAELPFAPGATIFFSTKLAFRLAPRDLADRARGLTCVYRRGFGKLKKGVFPQMSKNMLVPLAEAPEKKKAGEEGGWQKLLNKPVAKEAGTGAELFSVAGHPDRVFSVPVGEKGDGGGAAELYSTTPQGDREFRHALVQQDSETGEEYIIVHSLCVDHLEEESVGPLPWAESMRIIEGLLAPASRPPHVLSLNWKAGDYAIWDNRCTFHNVTPTHENLMMGEAQRGGPDLGFVALGEKRLMLRTEMQSSWVPRLHGPTTRRQPQQSKL